MCAHLMTEELIGGLLSERDIVKEGEKRITTKIDSWQHHHDRLELILFSFVV